MKAETIVVNDVPMVKMQAVYDEIIAHYGWDCNTYKASKNRLLRNKYSFLV